MITPELAIVLAELLMPIYLLFTPILLPSHAELLTKLSSFNEFYFCKRLFSATC
jgi:hypothetical protein